MIPLIERLKDLLSDTLSIAHPEDADTLQDLGADSLDLVEICSRIEEDFSVEIAEREIPLTTTITELSKLIESRIS